MLLFADVAHNTSYAVATPQIELLCDFFANGAAWLSTGRSFEMTGVGRQLSRPTWNDEYAITLNTTRLRIVTEDCTNASAVAQWADNIDLHPSAQPFIGNKHFYNSDHMVHRRSTYTASMHMHSVRTVAPECGNGENLAGEYLGQGGP
jgi:chondroitin AC lyase